MSTRHQPSPISILRRRDLMAAELGAEVDACGRRRKPAAGRRCEPAADRPGWVRLCPDHLVKDVFARL
jgi:hypothetical protein